MNKIFIGLSNDRGESAVDVADIKDGEANGEGRRVCARAISWATSGNASDGLPTSLVASSSRPVSVGQPTVRVTLLLVRLRISSLLCAWLDMVASGRAGAGLPFWELKVPELCQLRCS